MIKQQTLSPYLQREALKKAMWEAHATATTKEAAAAATGVLRDYEAAYEAARQFREACDAYNSFGKQRETTA